MDNSKVLVDLGNVSIDSLKHDLDNPVHMRYTATFDHDINDELIIQAWTRTKRVYPIIDSVLEYDKELIEYYGSDKKASGGKTRVLLVKTEEGVNDPIKSKVTVAPGTDAAAKRTICISYYERKVTISGYHIVTDGSGLNMIFNTFLFSYLALYTGHEDEKPTVELREGRKPDEYYTSDIKGYIYAQEYNPVPLYSLPSYCKTFNDKGLVFDGNTYSGSLSIPVSEFMKLCKDNGSNPSSMLCVLTAKASYGVNKGETDDVVFVTTLSLKKVLGLNDDIANASSFMVTYASYDDAMKKSLADVTQRIRKDLDMQRTKDYCITHKRMEESYSLVPKFIPKIVTYLGTVSIGDNMKHIVDFSMENDGHYVVYMMQLNDRFIITFQYDNLTGKYLSEMQKVLGELGIEAEITHPVSRITNDSKVAVL